MSKLEAAAGLHLNPAKLSLGLIINVVGAAAMATSLLH